MGMKARKPLITSILLLLFLAVTSFNAQAFNLFGKKLPKEISYEILDAKLDPFAATDSQKNALLALEAGLRGVSDSKIKKAYDVKLKGDDLGVIKEVIQNLEIQNIILDLDPQASEPNMPLSGYITFADEVGRSLQLGFIMQTNANSQAQEVQVTNLNPIFWGTPNIELFIVPEEALDASTASAEKNYINLYKNISSKSINVNNLPYGQQTYFIVAFFKGLVPPGVLVSLKTSNEKDGPQGSTDNNKFQMFEGGWVVAIQSIDANLQAEPKWAKITYQADTKIYEGMDDAERIIGLFQIGASGG